MTGKAKFGLIHAVDQEDSHTRVAIPAGLLHSPLRRTVGKLTMQVFPQCLDRCKLDVQLHALIADLLLQLPTLLALAKPQRKPSKRTETLNRKASSANIESSQVASSAL